jgi:2-desacetyl-2-hydroxyethyl bacteriochlorophyllide A dehydrogenase
VESLNIVFPEPGRVELRGEPVPSLQSSEILVRTRRSLISTGTELTALHRDFEDGTFQQTYVRFPMRPGYGNAGVVEAVADDVTEFQPGDRVASRGKHGQLVAAPASRAAKIPPDVTDDQAAFATLAAIAQIGVRRAQHELGDIVAVVGLGLVGQLAVQYARLSGAREVIAIGASPMRLELARSHGTTATIARGAEDALDELQQLTGGRLADVVYECTNNAAALAPSLKLVRRLGKLILLGTTGYPSQQRLTGDFVSRGISIIPAHNGHPPAVATDRDPWTHRHMAELFFDYLRRGQMRVDELIRHRFAPHDAPQAYRMLGEQRSDTMGVMFQWPPP